MTSSLFWVKARGRALSCILLLIIFPASTTAWNFLPSPLLRSTGFGRSAPTSVFTGSLKCPRPGRGLKTLHALSGTGGGTPPIQCGASHPIDVSLEAWKFGADIVANGPSSSAIQFPSADPGVVAAVGEHLASLSSRELVAEGDRVDWTVSASETELSIEYRGARMQSEPGLREPFATIAKLRMQRWVKRVIVGMKVCPFTQSVEWAATGLEKVDIEPGPISYPMSGNTRLVHVMVDLWADIAAMLSTPPTEHSTTLLLLPKYAPDDWNRFQLASHLIVKSLISLSVDNLASVVFFHPFYNRDSVEPVHEPIHGHLPPGQMLRSMLLVYYDMDEIMEMDPKLHQNDYSRRTPFPMINVLRTEQVQKAEELTSGTKVYCANGTAVPRVACAGNFHEPCCSGLTRSPSGWGTAKRMATSDAAELARELAKDMVAKE